MTSSNVAKVLGEAKVPWIAEHCLDNLVDEFENGDTEQTLRHALGQIARYMLETRLKYGFLTTYEQTIFLRKADAGRVWGLEYSPSLYHIGLLALADSAFNTGTGIRNQFWTRNA
ncbi:phosphoglycerate mutase family protein [Penicillium digitatum]|uniref:Phosphoglycerate mutase family protein n=1 Tax=Penicillium digitatum TaxID=36651 RepID=A0A7T7BJJ5_PENDI|nr:phosphoglycerate mutase family protein [Penicillium digitatum]